MTFDFQSRRSPNYQKPSHIPGKRSKAFAGYIVSIPEQKRSSLQQRMLIRHNNGECIGCTHQGVPLGVNGMELPVVRVMRGFFAPPEFCDCELGVRYSQRIERQREEFIHKDRLERYTYACKLFTTALVPPLPEGHTLESWPVAFEKPPAAQDEEYLEIIAEREKVRNAAINFMRAIEEPELVKKKGLCIQGYPGVGKTGLALGVAAFLPQADYYMLCLNAPALLTLIQRSEQEEQMVYTLRNAHIVLLDDLGDPESMDLAPYTVRRILTDVFEARYNASLPTIVTTGLDNEQLREQFSDSVFSIMEGLCYFYELPGINFRKE
ncbi:ATP-binding protein [Ktedonobacter robiniae]|uniref:ATP-binding protein n=1 Tax=Ktedonobacter robiniae TaxID=2778365 RepID=UPI00191678FA|nr:ATP-binding protein [Ktedonobacter robiniae]